MVINYKKILIPINLEVGDAGCEGAREIGAD